MRYVYIAGPYTATGVGSALPSRGYFEVDANIRRAAEAAARLAEAGVGFFCPHLHSAHFEVITPSVPPAFWYELGIHFQAACDALLLLPGWEHSKGTQQELRLAQSWSMPVFHDVDEVIAWAQEGNPVH